MNHLRRPNAPALTDADVEGHETSLENLAVRDELRAQLFAVDELTGEPKMRDREYARLWRRGVAAAVDLDRHRRGLLPEDHPAMLTLARPDVPKTARANYEAAVGKKHESGRLLMEVDPKYRAQVEDLGARLFGTRRRDATGRIVG